MAGRVERLKLLFISGVLNSFYVALLSEESRIGGIGGG